MSCSGLGGVSATDSKLGVDFKSGPRDFQARCRTVWMPSVCVLGEKKHMLAVNMSSFTLCTEAVAIGGKHRDICLFLLKASDYSLVAKTPPGHPVRLYTG